VGDGLDGVVEAVAVRSAVAEDLVVPRAADHMLHSGTHVAVGGIVRFFTGQQQSARAFAVRHDRFARGRSVVDR
jgi:hypothetical protein